LIGSFSSTEQHLSKESLPCPTDASYYNLSIKVKLLLMEKITAILYRK
jgi:hypothetical protein